MLISAEREPKRGGICGIEHEGKRSGSVHHKRSQHKYGARCTTRAHAALTAHELDEANVNASDACSLGEARISLQTMPRGVRQRRRKSNLQSEAMLRQQREPIGVS